MLQMKAHFGLLIGKRIRLYYDGKHNYQQLPLLLDRISYEKDHKSRINFVSIFYKENFLNKNYESIVKNYIDEISRDKTIKTLKNKLLLDETKEKIFDFLRAEFETYGTDVVEGALNGIDLWGSNFVIVTTSCQCP